jgi:septal ring factor EnvC (AmiA/AmiB activator)
VRGVVLRSVLLCALCALVAPAAHAQASGDKELREQREELDRIRRERESLEHEAGVLRSTAHELSAELANLDQRVAASARLVAALDRQLQLISDQVTTASTNMVKAEVELDDRKRVLQQRVVDVYKRGPMFTVEALLSARSFGELVARYKYLHDLTLRDRALRDRVEELRNRVVNEHDRLMSLQKQLEASRADRKQEEERLRELEDEQASNLRVVQQQAKRAESRIELLKRTEIEIANALEAMEAARKKAEAEAAAAAAAAARRTASTKRGATAPAPVPAAPRSAITTADYGKLDWPVEGTLVYTFGKDHWKGIGIGAPAGTPVKVVADGKVAYIRAIGTYGLSIFIDHGAGNYTIYGSLKQATVKEGQTVTKGDVIGETGVSDPDLPAHLHFEVRTGGRDAVDPMKWLRSRR